MNKTGKILVACLVVLFVSSGILAFIVLSTPTQPSSNEIRVACVGDSLTQSSGYTYDLWQMLGGNAPYTYANSTITPPSYDSAVNNGTIYPVGNFGAGSTTVLLNTETPYMNTSVFQDALDYAPDMVFIMLGTNDAQPNLEIYNASFVGDYVTLINAFKALPSNPKIWVMLPPPVLDVQTGHGRIDPQYLEQTIIPSIQQAAAEADVPTINLFTLFEGHTEYYRDGVHLNEAGAQVVADQVYNVVVSNSAT
jgi:lysophospholipase L1-like esterase